jgi:hypothetical protein
LAGGKIPLNGGTTPAREKTGELVAIVRVLTRQCRAVANDIFGAPQTASDFRLNCATPPVDRGWVGGKNSKLLIYKLSPRFVVGRRNRGQQGESGSDRCPECAGETITGDFELPELVQQNEVTPRRDIALHRGRSGNGAGSIKVAHRHARAQIVKDRKSCLGREVSQIAGLTTPIGEPVILRDEAGQSNIRAPLLGQCTKDGLNLNVRRTPDYGDNFGGVFHDSLRLDTLSVCIRLEANAVHLVRRRAGEAKSEAIW